mmetsp:Transcript_145256/g.253514  ORF Transcript_145256/g.253514 Transcript_145256/m.253514 type:complete len:448 (-) Transcript_145256:46-1389(-)
MRVLAWTLLLLCGQETALGQQPGCGPNCLGTCFAGTCLYGADDLESEDALRNQMTEASTPQRGPQAPSPMQHLTRVAQPAMGSTASSPLADEDAQGADVRQSLREPAARRAATSAAGGREYAAAGTGVSSSLLTSEAQQLLSELNHAQAGEAQLRVENDKLRRELSQWRTAGAHIAGREAKVVELLGRQPVGFQPEQLALLANHGVQAAMPREVPQVPRSAAKSPPPVLAQLSRKHLRTSDGSSLWGTVRWFLLAVTLSFLAISCLWSARSLSNKNRAAAAEIRPLLAQGQGRSGKCNHSFMGPVLREVGLSDYKVEISEIHLGSLFAGSTDVSVKFCTGSGQEFHTQVIPSSNGAFSRFNDVFSFNLRKTDNACVISVSDKRGELAVTGLPAAEIVRLARRPYQEYFRTELEPMQPLEEAPNGKRPYVAMRIRDVTAAVEPADASS